MNTITTYLLNFLVFLLFWMTGCYAIEKYISSVPWIMMWGYITASIGTSIANHIFPTN